MACQVKHGAAFAAFPALGRAIGAGRPRVVFAAAPTHKGPGGQQRGQYSIMPTLFRFLVTLAILGGIAYGAMFALVTFVEPNKGEMTVRIPAEKFNPRN
jgi:hypothetical protein